jgi:hypothetical protein
MIGFSEHGNEQSFYIRKMLKIPQLSRALHYGVLSLITTLSNDWMTVNKLPTILRLSQISRRFNSSLLSITS